MTQVSAANIRKSYSWGQAGITNYALIITEQDKVDEKTFAPK